MLGGESVLAERRVASGVDNVIIVRTAFILLTAAILCAIMVNYAIAIVYAVVWCSSLEQVVELSGIRTAAACTDVIG